MNRLTLGTVPMLAILVLGGCSTDSTDDLRNGVDKLVAQPTLLSLAPGQSKTVEVGAVDAQGNQLSTAYEATDVGAGITVRRDSTFLPIFVDDTTLVVPPTGPRFRFVVTAAEGNNFQTSSFKVVGGGKDVTIPVRVEPLTTIAVQISNQTPALGEVVTLTMPAGLTLTPDATVSFADESQLPVIISRAPDGTSISFLVPPNFSGPLRVNGVQSAVAPDVVFTPLTDLTVTAPQFDSIDVVFSTATPTIGQTITATLPALMKFGGTFDFDGAGVGGPAVPATFLPFQGQVSTNEPITLGPDSTTATFLAPANAVGPARIDSIIFPGGFKLSLPTRTAITVPSIGDTAFVTFSTSTPALGELVTATAPAGFRFSADNIALAFGTRPGAVQSVSADSSSLQFVALPGTVSNAVISGLRFTAAPDLLITLPNRDSILTAELTPLPNADDPLTAPALTVPGPGASTVLFDAGPYGATCLGVPSRMYKIVLTSPASSLTVRFEWFDGVPQFMFLVVTGSTGDCDAAENADVLDLSFGPDDSEQPPAEVTLTDLAAGTYFVHLGNDDLTDPSLVKITLERGP